ncbi:MAG: acyl-CoA dehydrogenase family protein [Myxococcota bacterium]|nr:acyl-CoA dehydrogenase family protein [Myxococcota bacterium]
MADTARSPRSVDWRARAHRVAPVAREEALACERAGTLTDRVVRALGEAGLFGLSLPGDLGGAEQGLEMQLEVFEEVSRADGSAGWCLMSAATASAFAGAYCDPGAAREMFGGGSWVTHAGQYAPRGQGVVVPGGFRVSGEYSFGSGCAYSAWIAAGFVPLDDGQPRLLETGLPDMRVACLPRDEVLFQGNWHVAGLQGTGSFDYRVLDKEVPEGSTFSLFADVPRTGGALYRCGVFVITACGHAGFALGVGRHALDEIEGLAPGKVRMGAPTSVAHSTHFQYELARAEAKLRSARAFVFDAFGDLERTVLAGDVPRLEQRALVRTATTWCTEVAAEVADFAYRFAGTDSLRMPSDLQRAWRDIHAGTQHVFVDDKTYLDSAQIFLGIAPETLPI